MLALKAGFFLLSWIIVLGRITGELVRHVRLGQRAELNSQTNTKTKTKKIRRVVSNRYSLVDIPNHDAGVKDGAWDGLFFI